MAKRKFTSKKKRNVRRRGSAKRSYKGRRSASARRPRIFGPAKSAVCKMVYRQSRDIAAPGGAGIPVDVQFRCNATYDPDATGLGGQPRGHDNAYQLYNHGTVLGSKITIRGTNSDNLKDYIVAIGVKDSTVHTGLTKQEVMEDPHSHYIIVPGGNKTVRTWSISHKFSSSKFFGRSKTALIGASQYREQVNTLPDEAAYYYLRFYTLDDLDTVAAQTFIVSIEYNVVMTEPKNIGVS